MEILPEISSKVRKYDTSVRDYVCVYSVHACTVVINVVLPEVPSRDRQIFEQLRCTRTRANKKFIVEARKYFRTSVPSKIE